MPPAAKEILENKSSWGSSGRHLRRCLGEKLQHSAFGGDIFVDKPSGTLTRAIPIVGMPFLIGEICRDSISVRFPHISPLANLFPPGTHLFFRCITKLVGSPDSQPKRLSETHFPKIQPETQLLYFSNISSDFVADPRIFVA